MSSTDHAAARYVVCGVYINYNSNSDCDWAYLRDSPVARNYATEVSDRGNEVAGKVLTSRALCGYSEKRTNYVQKGLNDFLLTTVCVSFVNPSMA